MANPETDYLFEADYWNGVDIHDLPKGSSEYDDIFDDGGRFRASVLTNIAARRQHGDILPVLGALGAHLQHREFKERQATRPNESVVNLEFTSFGTLFAIQQEVLTTAPIRIPEQTGIVPLPKTNSLVEVWKGTDDTVYPTVVDGPDGLRYITYLHWGFMLPRTEMFDFDQLVTVPFSSMPKPVTLRETLERIPAASDLFTDEQLDRTRLAPLDAKWLRHARKNAGRIGLPIDLTDVYTSSTRRGATLRRVVDMRAVEVDGLAIHKEGTGRKESVQHPSAVIEGGYIPGITPAPGIV